MKTNQIISCTLFLIFLSFPSFCLAGFGAHSSRHNDEIDIGIRKEIHELNEKIILCFKDGNFQYVKNLFLDEVKDMGLASNEEFYQQGAYVLSNNNFKPSHDYLVKYMGIGKTNSTVFSETEPAFFINLSMSNLGQQFVSILESNGNFNDYILCLIYQKVKKQWRLQTCHLGIIRIANKGVMDWYSEAEGMYEKTHYLSALLRLSIAGQFLRPAPFIQYKDEKKVKTLNDNCLSQLKRIALPHEVQLPTKPQILSIVPQFVKSGLIPLVNYFSSIPFENEAELKSEAHNILPELERLFPDITSYSDQIIFKAFNEMPLDPQKQYATYGIVVKTNE